MSTPKYTDLKQPYLKAEAYPRSDRFGADSAKASALIDTPHVATYIALDLRGLPIELAVWKALQAIPPRETRSYGVIAKTLPMAATAQDVGAACAANRIAVAVPCHRVGEGRRLDLRIPLGRATQAPADQHRRSGLMKAHTADPAATSGSAAKAMTIEARVDAIDWVKIHADLDAQGWAVVPSSSPMRRRTSSQVSIIRSTASAAASSWPARFRPGRVQVFQLPAAVRSIAGAADRGLSPARADRQRAGSERMAPARSAFPAEHAGVPRALPSSRPGASDAAAARVRARATTIACIATSTASMSSRCRLRFCWTSPARTSRAANS